MKVKVQILGHEKFDTKKGVLRHQLACLDMDTQKRLINTFDYSYSDLDQDTCGDPEKLIGKIVEIGLTHIEAGFGGRIRTRGEILTAPKAA
ncbi:hypothetical protein [Pontiella sulfatireligans]|uniref:Uncharacterized protein n=1 Tax=Pontiella sulfatireligans TaxID=2750658 RepID=A0A6C2UQZ4_9BACT|nr:hypothetical protein [Pontiella sulfatireligans]VGO21714.1 hypothetical protein SCARR_03788 [Pontiella sulfatireligans]